MISEVKQINDNKSKFPIGELAQSASSSSEKADVASKNINNRKKALIKIGAIGVMLLALIIFGTI